VLCLVIGLVMHWLLVTSMVTVLTTSQSAFLAGRTLTQTMVPHLNGVAWCMFTWVAMIS
jgi:hypothetical protein